MNELHRSTLGYTPNAVTNNNSILYLGNIPIIINTETASAKIKEKEEMNNMATKKKERAQVHVK